MKDVSFQRLFSFPLRDPQTGLGELKLEKNGQALFRVPVGQFAVVTDLYAENLGGGEAIMQLGSGVSFGPGGSSAQYSFRIPDKERLALSFSTGLPIHRPVEEPQSLFWNIYVGNVSFPSSTASIRFRINGYYVDAPIEVRFGFPAPPQNGNTPVPNTFLAFGRASGNTSPLSSSSRGVIYTPINGGSIVENGTGIWTQPPDGSDWAFQFTDIAQPPPPGNFYILDINIFDTDGHTGHAEMFIFVN